MKRVLFIDHSAKAHDDIKIALSNMFELNSAFSLEEANKQLEQNQFDLLVLETRLPDGDGFAWCLELKKKEAGFDIPFVFLTDRSSPSDKVRGFNVGAADYVVKPFDSIELPFRLSARLKDSIPFEQPANIQVGSLNLSIPYQKVTVLENGLEQDLRLTPTEFRLLYCFIQNENQVLTRDQLLATIWSEDVHVLSRTIDKHISTLKKKLGSSSNYIQSVHSRGYRFTTSKSPERKSSQAYQEVAAPRSL